MKRSELAKQRMRQNVKLAIEDHRRSQEYHEVAIGFLWLAFAVAIGLAVAWLRGSGL